MTLQPGECRPNDALRAARLGRPSPVLRGEPMSRSELAEAVNAYLWHAVGRRYTIDGHTIARYERGAIRWPGGAYRAALRAVLGAASDAELGFRPTRRGAAAAGYRTDPADRDAEDRTPEEYVAELERLYAVDQEFGAGCTLPGIVRVVAAVEGDLLRRRGEDRRALLRIAARAAEFGGFLSRDLGDTARCRAWHDRAMEWAQQSRETPLQAYIMLRKAQAAYDERDALRMLDLTLAATEFRSALGPGLTAEVLQQQARGEAMLGASECDVRQRLDQARTALDSTTPRAIDEPGQFYSRRLLDLQAAICLTEAGRPKAAVELYRPLVVTEPSDRNRAYFSILMAMSLAQSGEPDEAAALCGAALPMATAAGSSRSLREAGALMEILTPWRQRPLVRDLDEMLRTVGASAR